MRNLLVLTLSAGLCVVASSASAQICVATAGNTELTGANSGQTLAINTCTATDQLASACNSLSPIGNAPDAIWKLTIGPGASSGVITVTPNGTGWNPYLMVLSGACSGSSTCVVDADDNGVGLPESGNVPTTAGPYWLMVTDESGITSCGTADLVLGTLPVSVQGFSVE